MQCAAVFVTGGTGYLGQPLLAALLQRGYRVLALVRSQSAHKLPSGVEAVIGDALDADSYARSVPRGAVFVHLVGVAHPAPWKSREFDSIDLASVRAALAAARQADIAHFVYLSVARPAPVMQSYQTAREQGEQRIRASGIPATFIKPWYVLGPGHRWPYLLLPFYALARCIPHLRQEAERLRLVTRPQMLAALLDAIGRVPQGVREIEIPEIARYSI